MRSGWILGCLALAGLASAVDRASRHGMGVIPVGGTVHRAALASSDLRGARSATVATEAAEPADATVPAAGPAHAAVAGEVADYRAWLAIAANWSGVFGAATRAAPEPPPAPALQPGLLAPAAPPEDIVLAAPWSGDLLPFDPVVSAGAAGVHAGAQVGRALLDREPLGSTGSRPPGRSRRLNAFAHVLSTQGEPEGAARRASAGLAWTGAFGGREHDVFGVAAQCANFGDDPSAFFGDSVELALRLFYRLQSAPRVWIVPDLGYVIHPGGDATQASALVTSLRIDVRL